MQPLLLVTRSELTNSHFRASRPADGRIVIHHTEVVDALRDKAAAVATEVVLDLRSETYRGEPDLPWGPILSMQEVDRQVVAPLQLIARLASGPTPSSFVVLTTSQSRALSDPRSFALQAAAIGIVRAAAAELAPVGIRINAIAYPTYESDMTDVQGRFESQVEASAAGIAGFLLSDNAAAITGAVIPVDFGEHLYPPEGYEVEYTRRNVLVLNSGGGDDGDHTDRS